MERIESIIKQWAAEHVQVDCISFCGDLATELLSAVRNGWDSGELLAYLERWQRLALSQKRFAAAWIHVPGMKAQLEDQDINSKSVATLYGMLCECLNQTPPSLTEQLESFVRSEKVNSAAGFLARSLLSADDYAWSPFETYEYVDDTIRLHQRIIETYRTNPKRKYLADALSDGLPGLMALRERIAPHKK